MALGRFLKKLIDMWTDREKPARSPMEYDPTIDDERPARYWPSSRDVKTQKTDDDRPVAMGNQESFDLERGRRQLMADIQGLEARARALSAPFTVIALSRASAALDWELAGQPLAAAMAMIGEKP